MTFWKIEFSFNVVVNNFKKYDQSTKSTSNQNETIKKEALFHVFIYKQGDNPFTNNHFYKGLYRTNFSGQLTSVYDEIQLPRGIYDLYILSVLNSDFDQVPRFSIYEATSDYIYNKLDYAWCRILNVDIKQCDEKEVKLSMERSTVKFNVNFENGDSCTIDSIYDVRLTAPDHTHCYWNLYSGRSEERRVGKEC